MKHEQSAAAAVFFILLALLIAAACWVYVQERYEDGYSDGYRAAVEKMMIGDSTSSDAADAAPPSPQGEGYTLIPMTQEQGEKLHGAERSFDSLTLATSCVCESAAELPAQGAGVCSRRPDSCRQDDNAGTIWTEEELEALAIVIYQEAGADSCSDETRRMVADVVLNRVADERFPDTIEGVLLEKWQYGRFCETGIVWPESAQYECNAHAVERARRIAEEVLCGQHSEIYGEGYVFQAEFGQGSDGFWQDGIYFGK